jgi:hypothetical protein
MTQTKVQFVTKNGARLGDPIFIDTHHLPRAGEIVDTTDMGGWRHGTYIVVSVVYSLSKEGFIPLITAREWQRGLRSELLESRGWLPGGDAALIGYDEEDPAMDEPRAK